jgi:hypothetical protein
VDDLANVIGEIRGRIEGSRVRLRLGGGERELEARDAQGIVNEFLRLVARDRVPPESAE